jgi:hypothetical protein
MHRVFQCNGDARFNETSGAKAISLLLSIWQLNQAILQFIASGALFAKGEEAFLVTTPTSL